MSTHHQRQPQLSSPHKRHILPQLRLLAPKLPCPPVPPVQHRLLLEHSNTRDEQDTEVPARLTANVPFQYPAALQQYIPSVSPGYTFTSSPLLSPDPVVSSLEQKQHAVVTPYTNFYSDRVPLASADDYSNLAPGNLPRMITSESHGLSTENPPYGNLQIQETIQNPQGQDYWVPTLDTPEVWTVMAQPTIGVNQCQCSNRFLTQ